MTNRRPWALLAGAVLTLTSPLARAEEAPTAGALPLPAASPVGPPAAAVVPPGPRTWPDFIPLRRAGGQDLGPYGYALAHRVKRPLVITGACVFGAAYLLSGLAGSEGLDAESDHAGMWMFVPVVGPIGWGMSSGGTGLGNYLLGVDVVAQATGIALFAVGMRGEDGWERSFTLLPAVGPGGAAITAQGSF